MCERVDWVPMGQNSVQKRGFVNNVMDIGRPYKQWIPWPP
jgi:hypothetical protein